MKNLMMKAAFPAAVFAAAAGVAVAIPYDPTGEAGQFQRVGPATVVRGAGGNFNAVSVWAPWLLDDQDATQNSAACEVDAQGRPAAAVTTFAGGTAPIGVVRVIAALGTTDANWVTGESNNVFIDEGASTKSNSIGALVSDGTLLWRANFNSTAPAQNNLEYQPLPINSAAPAVPPGVGTNRVFDPTRPGIDGTVGGTAQLGTAGADRFNGDLFTGVTAFNAGTTAISNGVLVYRNNNNNPVTPFAQWLQNDSPLVPGVTAGDVRQTQPAVERLQFPGNPGSLAVCFGVGYSPVGGAIGGGSARPMLLVVDNVDAGGYSNGFLFIDADGDNNLAVTNPDIRFIDHQATGGGSGPFVGGQFDINARGQVVAVRENRGVTPIRFEVLLYNPLYNPAGQITGYQAPRVIATAGQDTIETNVQNSFYQATGNPPVGQIITATLVPFSGVAIDDNGFIAFTAVTEQFFEIRTITNPPGQPPASAMAPVLLNTTNTLFVWEPVNETLLAVVDGGQNGETLTNLGGGPDLQLGFFPIDVASDNFTREGLSETGLCMAVAFRSGGNEGPVDLDMDGFDDDGGVLAPGLPTEDSVRGVITVRMGDYTNTLAPCPGDTNRDRTVNFTDLNNVLANFGRLGVGIPGDNNNDFAVNFADLNQVLGNFGVTCP